MFVLIDSLKAERNGMAGWMDHWALSSTLSAGRVLPLSISSEAPPPVLTCVKRGSKPVCGEEQGDERGKGVSEGDEEPRGRRQSEMVTKRFAISPQNDTAYKPS